jgi:hypothetical protein
MKGIARLTRACPDATAAQKGTPARGGADGPMASLGTFPSPGNLPTPANDVNQMLICIPDTALRSGRVRCHIPKAAPQNRDIEEV